MTSGKTRQERIRALRDEALGLVRDGHESKALFRFAELEKLDPNEPDWPRRAAECHRVLGNSKEQVEALGRAAERYMSQGLIPKAIATCKVILSVDPTHTETQQRLAALHETAPARVFPVERSWKQARPEAPKPPPEVSQPAPALLSQPAPETHGGAPRAPRLDEILRKRRTEALRTEAEPKLAPSAPTPALPAKEELGT